MIMSFPVYAATQLVPPPSPQLNQSQMTPLNSDPFPSSYTSHKHHLSSTPINNIKPVIDPQVSWTSSVTRHCRNGRLADAAQEFLRMRLAGVEPNYITFVTLLSACADHPRQGLFFGASLHGFARKLGLDTNNVKVGTSIICMYSKACRFDLARLIFDEISMKNKVSWNSMIDGYMRNGQFESAVQLFDEMPQRDAVSWTALVGGFVRKGEFEQALEWFQEMQLSGVEPDYVTMISVLSACANLGASGLSLWLHRYVLNQDFKDNIRINNSIIDMYARCGYIEFARQVFDNMKVRSLVSWNSIIVGFAVNGHADEALEFFNMMQTQGFVPDGVSFTGALTACSHAGLVDEGIKLFHVMKKLHRISPRLEHYGCIVDLYSRAGRLEEALDVIQNMPMRPNEVVLGSLLAACSTRGDIKLAERLMDYLFELEPSTDSNYVLLSNIYAAAGSWHGASIVRKKMKTLGVEKKPGMSSIEIDGNFHEFVAGDKSHIYTESIYEMLDLLSVEMKMPGHIPETLVHSCEHY